jgi:PAS domain S-box-containing protein
MLNPSEIMIDESVLWKETFIKTLKRSSDGIFAFDEFGKIFFWNNSLELLTDYPSRLAVKLSYNDVFWPDSFAVLYNKVKDGEIVEIPLTRYSFKPGKKVYFKGNLFPVLDTDGKFFGGIGCLTQLTGPGFVEAEVLSEDDLIGEVESLARVGRWEMDIVTGYTFCSNQIYDIFEISLDGPVCLEDLFCYVHSEDISKVIQVIDCAREEKRSIDFNYRIITPNENLKYILGKAKPVLNEAGKLVRLLGYFQDITYRKRTDSLLSGIVHSSGMGFMMLKPVRNEDKDVTDFQPVFFNHFTEKFLNKKFRELRGKRFFAEYPGLVKLGILDQFKDVMTSGEPSTNEVYYGEDGFSNWLRISAVRNEDSCIISFEDYTERVDALEELRKNQIFLYQSQEAANICSFEWELKSDNFKVTPELRKMFDYPSKGTITFKDIQNCVEEYDRLNIMSFVETIIETNEPWELECKVKTIMGREIYCWMKATIFIDNAGEKKLVGSIMDITKRKKAELDLEKSKLQLERISKALKELNEELEIKVKERTLDLSVSNERFRLISNATNDSMWDWDFITNEFWFNDAYKAHIGFENLEGKAGLDYWKTRIHPDDRTRILDSFDCIFFSQESNWRNEYKFCKNDGTYGYVIDRGFVIRDEKGKVIRIVGCLTEITEIKAIESRLLESEETYRTLADSMPQLVWITNETGEIIFTNRKSEEYLGKSFDDLKGNGWFNFIHQSDLSKALYKWNQCLVTGGEFSVEYRLKNCLNDYRWFLSRAVPIKGENGKNVKWVGTSTDIHDQRMMLNNFASAQVKLSDINNQLNTKNEELKKINKELDNFVYMASHDLTSPVRNLESLMELLLNELNPDPNNVKLNFLINLVTRSISILKKTISDLSEVAKTEEDPFLIQEVHLDEVLEEVKDSIKDLIEGSEAIILEDFKVKSLKFRKKNMRSILFNLLSNAIKYKSLERKPVVGIRTELVADDIILLAIQDNGKGIRKEDYPKVFAPFKRIDYGVEGTGIGMSIVKRIVDNNGGKIEVNSNPGEGTVFNIFLKI